MHTKPPFPRWINTTLTLLLLSFVLSGCSTILRENKTANTSTAEILWEEQIARNLNIMRWSLKGTIGVKYGKKGGSATLNWNYAGERQFIELYGPFGGGRVQITTDSSGSTLIDTKGNIIQGRTAQEVLRKRLGWEVPFDELVMWSRGLASSTATEFVIDSKGRLESMKEGIWHVQFNEYNTIQNYMLPRKIEIISDPGAIKVYDADGNYIDDKLAVKVILRVWRDIKIKD